MCPYGVSDLVVIVKIVWYPESIEVGFPLVCVVGEVGDINDVLMRGMHPLMGAL